MKLINRKHELFFSFYGLNRNRLCNLGTTERRKTKKNYKKTKRKLIKNVFKTLRMEKEYTYQFKLTWY